MTTQRTDVIGICYIFVGIGIALPGFFVGIPDTLAFIIMSCLDKGHIETVNGQRVYPHYIYLFYILSTVIFLGFVLFVRGIALLMRKRNAK